MTYPPTGKRFGRWVVIGASNKRGSNNQLYWFCACDCGTRRDVNSGNIKYGLSVSCGCIRAIHPGATTHGKSNSSEYSSWASMVNRCTNSNGQDFDLYGGRGIGLCERWRNFENFYSDMGDKPFKGASIERNDNNGNYEPSNCRWASQIEQCNNQRRNRFIEHDGQRLTVSQWSRKLGIHIQTILFRLKNGRDPFVNRRGSNL